MNRRILFVLPDFVAGGAQSMNLRLARALRARGWGVQIAVLFDRGDAVPPELLDNLPITLLGAHSFAEKLALPWRLARLARADYVVVGGVEFAATIYGYAGATLARRPFVSWTHTSFNQHQYSARRIDRWISRAVYRCCRDVVFPSNGARDSLQVALGRKPPHSRWRVIENFVDISTANSASFLAPEGQIFARPVVVGIGRMVAIKAFDRLLRAHAALRAHGIDHHLLLLGDGPLKTTLIAQASALGVTDTVFMPGHVADPSPWLAYSQVFALCSRYEGLPLVLLEALAAGVPCVAMDCPSGPREILQDGAFGLLTPADDESAFQQAIEMLLTDDQKLAHYAKIGRQRALDYAPERIVPQWEALLTDICQEQAC